MRISFEEATGVWVQAGDMRLFQMLMREQEGIRDADTQIGPPPPLKG